MERFRESSISRLLTHADRYDCAAITAFRKYEGDAKGRKYTGKENAQRNASLRVKLTAGVYEMAALSGSYFEGGEVTRDRFFFVVNNGWRGDPRSLYQFTQRMKRFGEEFEQDAVLIIPKGAVRGDASRPDVPLVDRSKRRGRAFFIRTNDSPENWMKDQDLMSATVDETRLNRAVGDFLRIVTGHPPHFEISNEDEQRDEVEITDVYYLPGNISSLALANRSGRRPWREADVRRLRGSKPPADYSKIFR